MVFFYSIKCLFHSLMAVIFFFVYWPLALVFGYFAIMSFAEAKDAADGILPGDETIYSPPESGRSMEFGPSGPPWGESEPPLTLDDGRVIFVASIRSIREVGAKPPDRHVRSGVETPIPGTERPAYVALALHSGDSFSAYGEAADRLRSWFARAAAPEALPLPDRHE